jgi:NhaC family Na+:H+ antiporter
MLWTTIPSYTITIIAFAVLGSNLNVAPDAVAQDDLSSLILDTFNITPWLFLVPAAVVAMILFRIDAATTLFIAMMLGAVVAVVFQPELVAKLSPQVDAQVAKRAQALALANESAGQEQTGDTPTGETRAAQEPSGTGEPVEAATQNEPFFQYPLRGYNAVINAIALETQIPVADERAAKLLTSKGMEGMLNTVWLIICAMCFGGAMEAVGLLERITMPLVKMAQSTGALIGTTAASCLVLNFTASDQYLAIVVPGRMFRKTFEERGLAPENLSRTLEDAGTVTSVLVPWNTCGAAQSGVLGVATISYLPYCVFNYVSPLMTLFFGAFQIAIAKKINDDVGTAK